MRQWKSHKIVKAEPIKACENAPGANTVVVDLANGVRVFAKPDLTARGTPAPGDYFVEYDDGYQSWSPAKAFEEGYTLLAARCPTCGEAVPTIFEHVDRDCGHQSAGIKHEIEQLREEIAFWRRDAAARLWGYMASAIGFEKDADKRTADLRTNYIMPTLAALRDADAKEWHRRCSICGEFIEPTAELRGIAVDEDTTETVHAACGDPDSETYRHEDPDHDARIIADAKAFIAYTDDEK